MTEIGFIRHGITDWNQLEKMQGTSDIPLNDEGRDQARKLASRLHQDEKWDMIITSDLSRAKETGEIIGKKLDLPVSFVDKRIQEINLGEIEGTTEAERITRWGSNWRELDLGIETDEKVANRGIGFLAELDGKYKGKRILVVSHGGLIRLTIQQLFSPDLYGASLKNTAISILKYHKDAWDCSLYNCSEHLG